MLRILQRNPDQLRMDRLAAYMREFAQLLGVENAPVFRGIKRASVGIAAGVPAGRLQDAWRRVAMAKSDPKSNPGRHLHTIEEMLGADGLRSAELLDNQDNVVYMLTAKKKVEVEAITIEQGGQIDGIVTGLVGADKTMHLHFRDFNARDIRFVVTDEGLARRLLEKFRGGMVRLRVHGPWMRTDDGWLPESTKCTVDSFEPLDATPLAEIMNQLALLEGNGWCALDDADGTWMSLRGLA